MTSFWDLGILAAGPVGGLVAENAGFRTAFWTAAAMAVAALAVTAMLPRGRPPEPGMKQADRRERSRSAAARTMGPPLADGPVDRPRRTGV
jgi:predicted MFS family arabinose efflux permease